MRSSGAIKQAKRRCVQAARKALRQIDSLRLQDLDIHRYVIRHKALGNAVVALWLMGFTPEQVATFVADDRLGDHTVLAIIRRYLAVQQDLLIDLLLNGKIEEVELHVDRLTMTPTLPAECN